MEEEEIGLWVCPQCHVLQGIEVWREVDGLRSRCVSCGVPLEPESVKFLNLDLTEQVIDEVFEVIPEFLHDYIRFSWVSNKTVGLVFEFSSHELMMEVDYDPLSYFEDEIGPKLGLTMTVFFE